MFQKKIYQELILTNETGTGKLTLALSAQRIYRPTSTVCLRGVPNFLTELDGDPLIFRRPEKWRLSSHSQFLGVNLRSETTFFGGDYLISI